MAKRKKDADAQQFTPDPVQDVMQNEEAAQGENQQNVREMMPLPVDSKRVREAGQILQRYKDGKANLDSKIVHNEQYIKLRQWDYMPEQSPNDPRPASAWLWNCIQSKHADVMDGYPEASILPREEMDKAEAEILSDIIPVILEQNDFEQVYSDVALYTIKNGGGVYGVYWDGAKHNGLGDITVRKVDFINLFWEPGITDIQKSANVFTVELVDNDILLATYPQLQGKVGGQSVTLKKYLYDDHVDTSNKSVVVDWYYHKPAQDGSTRQVLHYCKFCEDTVLFATENNPYKYQNGWYDHGKYPFVVQSLFPLEGSLCGYGYVDIGKGTQEQIDLLDAAIIKNSMAACRPRWFIRSDGSINEEEYADWNKEFIHVPGGVDDTQLRQVTTNTLPAIYANVRTALIDELKETTGNRDVSNGGTTSGVTAASAIAAMQEQSGKLSRDTIKRMYVAYRDIVRMVIELMRQFYTVPRVFRITGPRGMTKFVSYTNAALMNQQTGFGGLRKPEFDVEITSAKQSAYTKISQNELALQLYQLGFFQPQNADSALACLQAMDFDRKPEIEQIIQENGLMYQQLVTYQQLALQMAKQTNPMLAEQIAAQIISTAPTTIQQSGRNVSFQSGQTAEKTKIEKSKAQAQEATQPT